MNKYSELVKSEYNEKQDLVVIERFQSYISPNIGGSSHYVILHQKGYPKTRKQVEFFEWLLNPHYLVYRVYPDFFKKKMQDIIDMKMEHITISWHIIKELYLINNKELKEPIEER